MTEEKQKTNPIVWVVVVIAILFLGYKLFTPKWTLMICDEVMENGLECGSFQSVHKDSFSSKENCMASGYAIKNSVFECGRNCKHDGVFMLCKEICDMKGRCN